MTLVCTTQETATGCKADAGAPDGSTRAVQPILRSQANAPRLQRPGRSFFR
jgi:hypothetical protein